MASDLSEAKRLFQEGSFQQCKRVLLQLYTANSTNPRILQKLGDVCIKLNQINDAEKHYRKLYSLNSDALNASNAKSLFALGKFLFDDNRLEAAADFLEKSLKIHESGAAHYYLGLIRDGKSDSESAIHHFQMAAQIQPKISRYHFQLAKCLQSARRYNEAIKSYEKALELTEHKDAIILNAYSQFQYQCMGKTQLALDFASLAAALDDRFSLKLNTKSTTTGSPDNNQQLQPTRCDVESKQFEDLRLHHALKNRCKINYSSLKCIMYDFDAAIQYLSLEQHVNGNLHNVDMMLIEDFLIIFGRRDRINRLINHFEKLQSIKIRIGLYIPRNDDHYRNLVVAALKRAYLYSYFEFIEDSDSVIGIAERLQLNHDEIFLVSGRGDYQCPKRFGLSMYDLECIESNLGFGTKMHAKFDSNITPFFLSKRNLKLYRDLRKEILQHNFHHSGGLHSLESIAWIKQSATETPFVDIWIEFAAKFLFMIYCSHTHRLWTALTICELLLKIEPKDPELQLQRPSFLASVGRSEEAEVEYRNCLHGPYAMRVRSDWGFMLYAQGRFEEAEDVLSEALRVNPVSFKAIIGYGRTLDRTHRRKEAEYYFLKALAIDSTRPMGHVRYGQWLFWCQDDLEGALHHFKIAERLHPESDKTQYFLSKIYRELQDMKMARQSLIQCLSLNPTHIKALADYREYFGNPEQLELDQKSFVLSQKRGLIKKDKTQFFHNMDNREFCIFWVHHSEFFLRRDAAEFEKYYFAFKREGMFAVTNLFNVDRKALSAIIGINNPNHIEMIMECIEKHVIRPYEDFKNWLINMVDDRQIGSEMMDTLLHQAIVFSFESFARNISSEGKLRSFLGARIHVHKIWNTFWRDYC